MISGSSTPRWRTRPLTRIQPEANPASGSAKRRDQRSPGPRAGTARSRLPACPAHRRPRAPRPGRCRARDSNPSSTAARRAARSAGRSRPAAAARSAAGTCPGHRRRPGACAPENPERGEELRDLLPVRLMAEDRQSESRLGDEEIAGHQFEGRAGRVARGACSRRRSRRAGPDIRSPPGPSREYGRQARA